MRSLAEGSPPRSKSDDQNLDVEITERSSEAAQIQPEKEVKEVAYLRNTDIYALYPAHEWLQEKRRGLEGAAHQFVSKLRKDISKSNPDQRKNEIYFKEFHRYVVSHGRADLLQKFKSPEDINNLPSALRCGLNSKEWYFNRDLNHEVADEYQLLSLGHQHMPDEVIPDLCELNNVGNALEADLQYQEFFSTLSEELQWDDTEEQGVRKTIAIRDMSFPNINDRVIPWALNNWAEYKWEQHRYSRRIDMYRQLWVRVEEEKEDVFEVLSDLTNKSADDWMQNELERIKDYIEERSLSGSERCTRLLTKDYLDATQGEPKPDGGDYLLYVKEKIRMALRLGIIQKEDVAKSMAGSQLLKNIENYDPCYFRRDVPLWHNRL